MWTLKIPGNIAIFDLFMLTIRFLIYSLLTYVNLSMELRPFWNSSLACQILGDSLTYKNMTEVLLISSQWAYIVIAWDPISPCLSNTICHDQLCSCLLRVNIYWNSCSANTSWLLVCVNISTVTFKSFELSSRCFFISLWWAIAWTFISPVVQSSVLVCWHLTWFLMQCLWWLMLVFDI